MKGRLDLVSRGILDGDNNKQRKSIMKKMILILGSALALAGCGKEGGTGDQYGTQSGGGGSSNATSAGSPGGSSSPSDSSSGGGTRSSSQTTPNNNKPTATPLFLSPGEKPKKPGPS